jgi:hypothetical protein
MTRHDTKTSQHAAELLAVAADRVERCGLFQGEYWPINPDERIGYVDGDPCCALGALAVAAGFDDAALADTALDSRPELILAIDTLTERIDGPPAGEPAAVPAWNDHPGRTHLEVARALRAAAEQLRAQAPARPDTTPGTDGPSPTHQQMACEVITNV